MPFKKQTKLPTPKVNMEHLDYLRTDIQNIEESKLRWERIFEDRLCKIEDSISSKRKPLSIYDLAIIIYVTLLVVYIFVLILKQRREYVRS